MYKKHLYLIHYSDSPSYRKIYIGLLVRCHLCPIWSPVLSLNLTIVLYICISFATVMSEPALKRFPISHVRNLMSIFFSLGRLSREFVHVRGPLWHFVIRVFLRRRVVSPKPKLNDHPLSAVATAYWIYPQLPSISGGRLLHPQTEDAPYRGDKGPI
jgi:hypothetical protein